MGKARPAALASVLLLASSVGGITAPDTPVPLFEGLGGLTRKITTGSREAQRYFDEGLAFMYAFNHDEAIRAFRRAAELDPSCAMAQWGVAIAYGPHINNPVVPKDRAQAAWEALAAAKARARGSSPVEKALIEALSARYADPRPEDRKPLDHAYAEAMRSVWKAYPRDADVGALFAESLADLRPWDLWTPDGQPQPGTEELLATLQAVLLLDPKHPLANDLLIHGVEASPHPERADRAADTLRDLQPGLGHLVHMPSHMRGELLYRSGKTDEGLAALREAASREDKLRYDEPPDWIQPVRHALGAALLQAGRFAEAEEVFRQDLAKLPDNGWALYGLQRSLELQRKTGEAAATGKRFDEVWKEADLRIKSACLCLPGV
jgi:tetratricopeptide (TPR) repeat protein